MYLLHFLLIYLHNVSMIISIVSDGILYVTIRNLGTGVLGSLGAGSSLLSISLGVPGIGDPSG